MGTTPKVSGLYAVTPDMADTALLLELVSAAIEGGTALVQYRNKTADEALRQLQATQLLALCRRHNVPLIINDHLDLCLAIDADGVHLGGTDGDIAATRARLGQGKILGVSCYDRLDLAMQAKDAGADYVAFGSCFSSDTKPGAVRAPLDLLAAAKQLGIAVVAIGGITLDNAALAIEAGADAVAVIGALWAAAGTQEAAQTFSNLFIQNDHEPAHHE
jgi:thiamine-phosphate pyrophosphorylase